MLFSFCAAADSKEEIAQELLWRNSSIRFTEEQYRKYLGELIQQLKKKSSQLVEQVKGDATADELKELRSIYSNAEIFEAHIENGVSTIFSDDLVQGYLDNFSYDELLEFKRLFNSSSYKKLIKGRKRPGCIYQQTY